MKKITVSLGMLIRQCKTVEVEVPDDFDHWSEDDQDQALSNIYSADNSSEGWEDDIGWGCEEGTHGIFACGDDSVKAEFIIDNNGQAFSKEK